LRVTSLLVARFSFMQSIKDYFLAEWDAVAPAWSKWQRAFSEQTAAATHLILDGLAPVEGDRVIDLGCGSGEPALSLARHVSASGRVVATDLVPGAVALVAERAREAGLGNLETRVADAEALPFASASFDALSCRLAMMFCPDLERALSEARRVLVPGGRVAFVAWGSATQPLFKATLFELGQGPALAARGSTAPGPFRFAQLGTLGGYLAAAGFVEIAEREVSVPWPFPGSAELMWDSFLDFGGPAMRATLDAMGSQAAAEINQRIVDNLRQFESGGVTDPSAVLIAVNARTPAAQSGHQNQGT
jgi:ubiquinone/menaquinone biosynthesis C-methylase UbiE